MKTIILDADGVILDFMATFERYLREVHGIHPEIPFREERDYGLSNMYPSMSKKDIGNYITSMSLDRDYFPSIPFVDGAEKAILALREAFPDTPIVCVTSCGNSPETAEMRRSNLATLWLDDVHVLPLGGDKEALLREYGPDSWFVDDLPANVETARNVGMRGLLFGTPITRHMAHEEHYADGWAGVLSRMGVPGPEEVLFLNGPAVT